MKQKSAFFEFIRSRSAELIQPESLAQKLSGARKVRVKLGIDATNPNLHLGHVVPLRILKSFQDEGHTVVLIIGNFTALIGDPSERSTSRTLLTQKEVAKNERTYLAQFGKILDLKKTEIRHNGEWYQEMRLADFLSLLTKFSLKSAWEREDFQKRLSEGKGVQLNEAMYHVLQGYDSVMVNADIELGAVDQKLNLLAGRELQSKLGRRPQDIILLPYLIGLDGREKMSKTFSNAIHLTDTADDMFGKVMSIPDTLIKNYAEFAAWLSMGEVRDVERRLRSENPRDVKLDLAFAITSLYHAPDTAAKARERFIKTFSKRDTTEAETLIAFEEGVYRPLQLLEALGATQSKSEARRFIRGRAFEVDGRVVLGEATIRIKKGTRIRVGKKMFFRVR